MAKRKAAKKKASSSGTKARSKTETLRTLSEKTGLTKRDVDAVLGEMAGMIKRDLGKRGPGVFTIPGLLKIKVVRKPATKARKGINPFTGEEMMFKAKPARNVVKAQPLKALKEMV